MLWLCIHLPQLPLEIFTQSSNKIVVIAEHQRVIYCNQNALQQGIKPGLAVATATALAETVRVIERSSHQEQQALTLLATLCYRFTPLIVVCAPFNILLDISGCLKLHHGLPSLQQEIDHLLQEIAYDYRLGLASTPKAAALLARCHHSAASTACQHFSHFDYQEQQILLRKQQQLIAEQKLEHLPASKKLQDKWQKLGFQQLADLQALPAAATGKRFGKEFLLYLQQLNGERPDPQQGIVMPQTFNREQYFLDGISNTEQLLFPAKRLLNEFCQYLSTRQLWCHRFCWRLQQQNMPKGQQYIDISIPLTQAQNSVANFLALTRLKLEHISLNSAVETICLEASEFSPAEQHSQSLFDDVMNNDFYPGDKISGKDQEAYQQLLDKLTTRLGENSILQLSNRDEHLPEFSYTLSPLTQKNGTSDKEKSHPTINQAGKLRPLFLLPKPHALQANKDGLYWQGKMYLLQGPERIESRWWQGYKARDYYLAQHENGSVYWIYQDLAKQRWYAQGIFS